MRLQFVEERRIHPNRETVHLTKPSSTGGFVRGHRHVHNGPLGPEDIVVVDGVRVIAAGLPLPRLQHTFGDLGR